MISSETEYRQALDELSYLNGWLTRLEGKPPSERGKLTTSSVRMMIARVQQEVAAFEAGSISPVNRSSESQPDGEGA